MTTVVVTEPELRLNNPVEKIGLVTERHAAGMARLGISSISDLIRHLPVKYEKQSAECPLSSLTVGPVVSTRGMIVATRMVPTVRMGKRPSPRSKPRFEATLEDHSGQLTVSWFNAPYLQKRLLPGLTIRIKGKASVYRRKLHMINPKWELLENPSQVRPHRQTLRPIYRATEQLPSAAIEQIIGKILPNMLKLIVDPLPADLVRTHAMVPLADAYRMAHMPQEVQHTRTARRRLAFNELLLLQLGIALKRKYNQTQLEAPVLRWSNAIDHHIRGRFPFDLTKAQNKVLSEIIADLQKPIPMNRLVQGDVGAGKTVVALYALLMAVANRKQGALMAPTELLAEQHYLSISRMLQGSNVRMTMLSGGQSSAGSRQRTATLSAIKKGDYDIVIGTQALVGDTVAFKDLAVVVIDEQHRFGVLQRAAFRTPSKGESTHIASDGMRSPLARQSCPHYLVMTATPIPRTLSLTVFGDLDISTITSLPPGRTPIVTRMVEPTQTDKVYTHLAKRLSQGEQAYVVVPAIDAPTDCHDGPAYNDRVRRAETAKQLKSVRAQAKILAEKYLSNQTIGIIHGRMKQSTRAAVMDRFRRGKIDCLVATTVIEVGVDVPNATMMVIEHAERFGLSQLHQLRGRIGRGSDGKKSLCVFVAQPTTEEATKRLNAIVQTNDGFKIAEHDLAIRGMGDFFGTRQHGMPPLRVARIPGDMELLGLARRNAQATVDADPNLADPSHHLLRQVLIQQYGEMLGLIDVG